MRKSSLDSINFLLDEVIIPASDERNPKKIIDKSKRFYEKLINITKTGDAYRYIKKVINTNSKQKSKNLFQQNGLKSFKDVIGQFEYLFFEELHEISSVKDLILDKEYTFHKVAAIANNHDLIKGIINVKDDNNKNIGLILKARVIESNE